MKKEEKLLRAAERKLGEKYMRKLKKVTTWRGVLGLVQRYERERSGWFDADWLNVWKGGE